LKFEDDGPTFIGADHGFVANTSGSSVVGDLLVDFGADGPAAADKELSLLSNVAPPTLTSGGLAVGYFVSESNPDELIAYTGANPLDASSHVFKLQLEENGTYTFSLYKAVDAFETVPIGSSTSFGAGPAGYQILANTAGTQQLALLSGWMTNSGFTAADFTSWLSTGVLNPLDTDQAKVNGSTSGWGIDNNNFDGGGLGAREIFRVDFDDTDSFDGFNPGNFDGPAVQFATIELIQFKLTDTVAYVVHYADGTFSSSGTAVTVNDLTGGDGIFTLGESGKFIDYIEFMAITGNGKFDLVDVATISNTGTTNLMFDVLVTDGDLDTTSGFIHITTDGSFAVIDGSINNDAIAGNHLANTLNGLGGDDILYGGAGNDVLNGGNGNDVLHGGAGNDVMTGGAGSDSFLYDSTDLDQGHDQILDFQYGSGGDKLDLGNLFGGSSPDQLVTDGHLSISTTGNPSILSVVIDQDGISGGTDNVTIELHLSGGALDPAPDNNVIDTILNNNIKTEMP